MDKDKVNDLLPDAYDILREEFGDKKVSNQFRGYFASFGASIARGSLLSAIAFISRKSEGTEADRHKLPHMILALLKRDGIGTDYTILFDYARHESDLMTAQKNILNATLALKLALNLFEIEKVSNKDSDNENDNNSTETTQEVTSDDS